jgi:hypothetical protein
MIENRRHFRLRDYFDVDWKVDQIPESGDGYLLNISLSGALLQTNQYFRPSDKCVIEIKPMEGCALPITIKKGQIVWYRRTGAKGDKCQCGVKFLGEADLDKKFNDWLQQKMDEISETANVNILNNYLA